MRGTLRSPRPMNTASSADARLPALFARYVYCCPWPLNLDALQAAARAFEGEHDFKASPQPTPTSHTARSPVTSDEIPPELNVAPGSTVRTIFSSDVGAASDTRPAICLFIAFAAMASCITWFATWSAPCSTSGRGHLAVDEIPGILAARSRSAAGPTAPARGLFLHSVDYPPEESVHLCASERYCLAPRALEGRIRFPATLKSSPCCSRLPTRLLRASRRWRPYGPSTRLSPGCMEIPRPSWTGRLELVAIPAPSYGEQARAAWLAERFTEMGLSRRGDRRRRKRAGNFAGSQFAA